MRTKRFWPYADLPLTDTHQLDRYTKRQLRTLTVHSWAGVLVELRLYSTPYALLGASCQILDSPALTYRTINCSALVAIPHPWDYSLPEQAWIVTEKVLRRAYQETLPLGQRLKALYGLYGYMSAERQLELF